jgi:glycosyltransferase involved in cell wall biosynthesis
VACAPLFPDGVLQAVYAGERRNKLQVIGSYARRIGQLLRRGDHDCLWIEVELLPFMPYALERLLLRGRPYVLDIDDAWFHRYQESANPAVRAMLGPKLVRLMRGASEVVVGSPYLEEYALEVGAQRVTCVPTAVDVAAYAPDARRPSAGDEVVIGWIGTPSNERYLGMIGEALADVCRLRNACFRVIGARPVDIPGVPVDFRRWSEETEATDLSDVDIGVMPLESGAWERGKCGYKLIQYMAASRPGVASPVGANIGIVEHGVTGFLADNSAAWRDYLLCLIDDAALRARMGRQARRIAEAKYDLATMAPMIEAALQRSLATLAADQPVLPAADKPYPSPALSYRP